MPKLLVAIDGSENSDRVIDYLTRMKDWYKDPVEVHLLNVQSPIVGVNVKMFISSESLNEYYREEGTKALKNAKERLAAMGLAYTDHISVGGPGELITEYAKSKGCDQILMGSRGLGSISGLVLGSVATKVLQLAQVPVLLVR